MPFFLFVRKPFMVSGLVNYLIFISSITCSKIDRITSAIETPLSFDILSSLLYNPSDTLTPPTCFSAKDSPASLLTL